MKTLANADDLAEILTRLDGLTPEAERQWGRMTPNQMLCHLTDAFRSALGERPVSPASNVFTRTVLRWIALKAPMTWPHGVRTRPEVDQEIGGTPPTSFESDAAELAGITRRFVAERSAIDGHAHSIFGPMTSKEWLRWGYLHVDHHLRQFGA